jgi:hypothetical protein
MLPSPEGALHPATHSLEAPERPDVGKKRGEEDHSRGLATPYGLHACAPEGNESDARLRLSSIFLPVKGISGAGEAYELTYTSCQESGKYNRLFASIREQFRRR